MPKAIYRHIIVGMTAAIFNRAIISQKYVLLRVRRHGLSIGCRRAKARYFATLYETAAAFPTISLFVYRQRWLTVPRPRHGTILAQFTITNLPTAVPAQHQSKGTSAATAARAGIGPFRTSRTISTKALVSAMAIRVHLNLRRGDWSLTDRGKVFAHVPHVCLLDAEFRVSEKSRQRVVKAHYREVHAWAIGERIDTASHGELVPISYNPFRSGSFVRSDTGAAITQADFAIFQPGKRAFAINPR